MKKLGRSKHSSLSCSTVQNKEKMFFNITTSCQCQIAVIALLKSSQNKLECLSQDDIFSLV